MTKKMYFNNEALEGLEDREPDPSAFDPNERYKETVLDGPDGKPRYLYLTDAERAEWERTGELAVPLGRLVTAEQRAALGVRPCDN